MAGVSRKNLDTAGGTLQDPPKQIPSSFDFCYVEGYPIAVLGQSVAGHGLSPHDNATMKESSTFVFVNSVGVVRAGDKATCDHQATGSTIVFSQ